MILSDQTEKAAIPGLPRTGFYIPNFLTTEEEQHILDEIYRLPPSRWTTLSHRRLLSVPSPLTGISRDTLLMAPLPKYLSEPVLPRMQALQLFSESPHQAPNHVLVNEYNPGEGIMPHEDGPSYFPITATVSLGSHAVLDIYKKDESGERDPKTSWRILQEPRSLLVTTSTMYANTLHGISNIEIDDELDPEHIANWSLLGNPEIFESGTAKREIRVSLTYRDVQKGAKLGGTMKFINKR